MQDLDYGWPVDRRGSVTIGNGPLYVHVKRSFQGHQLPSSGADRFPLEFRWAGKTYFIHTPDEVRIVNELLKATTESSAYTVATSFRNHQLFREAVQVDAQSGEHSLRRERTLAQVEVLSPDMRAGFMSPLGRIEWSHLYKSRASHFVPRQNLRVFVKDELMGWDSPGWYYDHELTANDPLAVPLVARRDRTRIKNEAIEHRLQPTALVHEVYLRLLRSEPQTWQNRRHFFSAAAEAMRRILIEHARSRDRLKRGGEAQREPLVEIAISPSVDLSEIIAVHEVLEEFEREMPDKAELVKLRYFAGLDEATAAETLGISRATASRWWTFSRAWLFQKLSERKGEEQQLHSSGD